MFVKIKNGNFGYYLQGKFCDTSCYRKIFEPLIIESFKIKTEKLQNYKQFNKNGLFIFTEMLLNNSYIKYFYDIFNNLNQQYIENSKIIYDFVILESVSSVFMIYIDMCESKNSKFFKNINNY